MNIHQVDLIGELCRLLVRQIRPSSVPAILDLLAAFLDSGRQLGYVEEVANTMEELGIVDRLQEIRRDSDDQLVVRNAWDIISSIKGDAKFDLCILL